MHDEVHQLYGEEQAHQKRVFTVLLAFFNFLILHLIFKCRNWLEVHEVSALAALGNNHLFCELFSNLRTESIYENTCHMPQRDVVVWVEGIHFQERDKQVSFFKNLKHLQAVTQLKFVKKLESCQAHQTQSFGLLRLAHDCSDGASFNITSRVGVVTRYS